MNEGARTPTDALYRLLLVRCHYPVRSDELVVMVEVRDNEYLLYTTTYIALMDWCNK
jgi:hypothetical protein